jgi:hypothetical protein
MFKHVFNYIIEIFQKEMKTIFHPAAERGHNDIGWLKANFSFNLAPIKSQVKQILAP